MAGSAASSARASSPAASRSCSTGRRSASASSCSRAREQRAREGEARVDARRLQLDGPAQGLLPALLDELLGLGRDEPCDELPHHRGRLGADELVDHGAVAERLHGRDALHAVALRQRRVAIDVDLDELDVAARVRDGLLEVRRQLVARPAPGRPEVHHDRMLGRAVEHRLVEARNVCVDRHGRQRTAPPEAPKGDTLRAVADPPAAIQDLAIPPGTEAVVGVYVNGVERVAGRDYEVLDDRIRLSEPIPPRGRTSGLGKVLISVGIGVYDKGAVIDVAVKRAAAQRSCAPGRCRRVDDGLEVAERAQPLLDLVVAVLLGDGARPLGSPPVLRGSGLRAT